MSFDLLSILLVQSVHLPPNFRKLCRYADVIYRDWYIGLKHLLFQILSTLPLRKGQTAMYRRSQDVYLHIPITGHHVPFPRGQLSFRRRLSLPLSWDDTKLFQVVQNLGPFTRLRAPTALLARKYCVLFGLPKQDDTIMITCTSSPSVSVATSLGHFRHVW